MVKIPAKKLIEFRRLTERRKYTFISKLKIPVEVKTESDGGNYWVRSISALSTAFKFNDIKIIQDRLVELEQDYELNERKQTKVMYQRNIEILYGFEDYDFSLIRPSDDLNFLPKPINKSILNINGLPIQILPNHVFYYGKAERPQIGGIWFVTWLDKYNKTDLGIYSELIFKYLFKHYSKDYNINPKDCIVLDASSMQLLTYDEILKGEIPSLLDPTLESIKKLL